MQIAMAPFKLKPGVTREALLTASDEFEADFAQVQEGIVRRVLVGDPDGGYADIVFFESKVAMDRVIEAEQTDEVCAQYMSLMADAGYTEFEVLKTYE